MTMSFKDFMALLIIVGATVIMGAILTAGYGTLK